MKKVIFLIIIVSIIIGAIYTVNNYNKSYSDKAKNKLTEKIIDKNKYVDLKENEDIEKIKAADFILKDLDGKEIALSDLRGKKIFLNFWATWCPPCKLEMPDIEKLYQETKDKNLISIAVNLGEDEKTVREFINENKYNFKVLLDLDQSVAINYNITSIPTSFFIDEEGNIVAKKIGLITLEDMKNYINLMDNK